MSGRRTISEYTVSGDSTTAFFTRLFTPQSRTFTIKNTNSQPVIIDSFAVQKLTNIFSVNPSVPLPATLLANQTMTFDVIFNPNTKGPFKTTIAVLTKPCDLTWLINLTGSGDINGLSPDKGDIAIVLDPCTFQTRCDTLTFSNEGQAAVTVTNLSFTPPTNIFTLSPNATTPFTVAPKQTRAIIICASPNFSGTWNGKLQITSTDPAYPLLSVFMKAQHDSSSVQVSKTLLDFGRHAICENIPDQEVVLTNTGTIQETVTPTLVNGGAGFTTSFVTPATILPGRQYRMVFHFNKSTYGMFDDTLLLVTQSCHKLYRIPIHAELDKQEYSVTPSPLAFPNTSLNGSSTRQLHIQNNGGFDGNIYKVDIQPSGDFTLPNGFASNVPRGNAIDVNVRFAPQAEGASTATLCVYFAGPCPDTICVPVSGTGVQGTLGLHPNALNYGTLAQCQKGELADTLVNTGTGPITLQVVQLTGTNPGAFTILTPMPVPEVIPSKGQRIFRIQYDASLIPADGPVSAALTISTDNPSLPMIDLPLDAARNTFTISPGGTLPYGLIEINMPNPQTFTLRNTGTAQLCYKSASLPAGITITPSLPFCIDAGKTLDITVTATLTATGPWSGRITLFTDTPCTDSTALQASATVQQGTLTQKLSYDFGAVAYCQTPQTTFDIRNTYLVDATLNSITVTGDTPYFTIGSPTVFPVQITSGNAQTIQLTFNPAKLNRTYTLTLTSNLTLYGKPVVLTTTITASSYVPDLSVTSAQFPLTVKGNTAGAKTMTVKNISGKPIHISSIAPSSTDFVIKGSVPPVPATLQAGDSIVVQVDFAPTASKNYTDSLVVTSDTPCNLTWSGGLTGKSIAQPYVQETVSIGALSGNIDAVIRIPVNVDKDLGGAVVTEWGGSITFNPTMLYPQRIITEGSLSSGMTVQYTYDAKTGKVSLTATGGQVNAGVGALAYVECLVLLGDAASTSITISQDFAITVGYATVIARQDGEFTLTGYCKPTDRLLTAAGFLLHQNVPNPVSSSIHGSTEISYSIAEDSYVELSVYDVMGRHVGTLVQENQKTGVHKQKLQTTMLNPGVYYYVLTSGKNRMSRTMVVIQ